MDSEPLIWSTLYKDSFWLCLLSNIFERYTVLGQNDWLDVIVKNVFNMKC